MGTITGNIKAILGVQTMAHIAGQDEKADLAMKDCSFQSSPRVLV